jgi:hypothetical protein
MEAGGTPRRAEVVGIDGDNRRYNWVLVRLAAIDKAEMRELVLDPWRMVVPKKLAAAYPR